MKRTITLIFLLFVILSLILTVAWAGYTLYNIRRENMADLNNKTSVFTDEFGGILAEKGEPTENLRKHVQNLFSEEGRLQAVIFYTSRDGIIYKKSFSDNKNINEQIENLPDRLIPPTYSLNTVFFFNKPDERSDESGTKIFIHYIYESISRSDIVYILKGCLIVVVALFLLTLIMIIVMTRVKETPQIQKPLPQSRPIPERRPAEPEPVFDDAAAAFDDFGDIPDDINPPEPGPNFDIGEEPGTPETEEGPEFDLDGLDLDIKDFPEEGSPEMAADDDDFSLDTDSLPDEPAVVEEEDFELPPLEDETEQADEEPQSLYSPRSELGWESFLDERLENELNRAASDNEDLVVILFQDPEISESEEYKKLADLIKKAFPHTDLAFEYTKTGFAVIGQNSDLETGMEKAEEIVSGWQSDGNHPSIKAGLSSRNGRLVDSPRLKTEAESALKKADRDNPVIAFRPDPDKYREFMSKKS